MGGSEERITVCNDEEFLGEVYQLMSYSTQSLGLIFLLMLAMTLSRQA